MASYDYGMLGFAKYATRRKEWGFSRKRGIGQKLCPFDGGKEIISSQEKSRDKRLAKPQGYHHNLPRPQLIQDMPQIAPALSFLQDFIAESTYLEEAETSSANYGRRLMAVIMGYAESTDEIQEEHLIAYATGITRAFRRSEKSGHRSPEIPDTRNWTVMKPLIVSLLQPIRQICLTRRNTFKSAGCMISYKARKIGLTAPSLGVRLNVRTDIGIHFFRYSSHRQKATVSYSDVKQVALLTPSMAAGVPYSDFDANPWNDHQLAVIDKEGNWSVWECRQFFARRGTQYTLYKLFSGTLNLALSVENALLGIKWAHNMHYLVAHHSKHIYTIDISVTPAAVARCGNEKIRPADFRYLDLIRSPINENRLYLLSNYSVTCLKTDNHLDFSSELCHLRHPCDITLCIEVLNTGDSTSLIILSKVNPDVTVLQIREDQNFNFAPAGDIYLLDLPQTDCRRLSIAVVPISYFEDAFPEKSFLFSIWSLSIDETVVEQCFIVIATGVRGVTSELSSNNPSCNEYSSGFIIQDQDTAHAATVQNKKNNLVLDFHNMNLSPIVPRNRPQGYNFRDLHAYAFDEEATEYKTAREMQNGAENFHLSVTISLENICGTKTLESFTGLQLDSPSNIFENLSDEFIKFGNNMQRVQPYIQLNFYRISQDMQEKDIRCDLSAYEPAKDVESRYNEIIKTWLKPLPANLSAKIRFRREKLARMIAADRCLASMGFYLDKIENDDVNSSIIGVEIETQTNNESNTQEMAGKAVKLFLDNLTCMDGVRSLDKDLNALLEDWEVGQPTTDYVWNQVRTVDRESSVTNARISRRSTRERSISYKSGGRASQIPAAAWSSVNIAQSAQEANASLSMKARRQKSQILEDKLSYTQPNRINLRVPRGSLEERQSQEAGYSQSIVASQTERGKYGSRNKTRAVKRKRIEGF